ncbi:MAG TPA: hypothetical protein VGP36_04720 [Mycobacteriales bacterium]|jgi:hypothetical protein|nr:hypothetical protein [Mycobacteriales bacterium]
MKDGLADGLARVRERVDALRGRDGGSGDRYVLLSPGAGRRRRVAEVSAMAGVGVVVLALVGATIALRPSSSAPPAPNGPGLPVPAEFTESPSSTPSASSSVIVVPGPTGGSFPQRPRSSSAPSGSSTPTAPAATTRASATVPPATHPTVTTPPATTPVPPPTTVPPTVPPTDEPTTEPPPPPPGNGVPQP